MEKIERRKEGEGERVPKAKSLFRELEINLH